MAEAELTTIARPYARAAFSKALDDERGLDKWSGMLAILAGAIDNQDVRTALDNPMLTTQEAATLLIGLCDAEVDDGARNFVRVLAEYDRIMLLPEISRIFESLKSQHEKTMQVDVTSAYEVTEDEQARLSEGLKRMLQRDIALQSTVDESLLGGVVIRADDTVIDNSIRGRLARLSTVLQ